MKVLLLGDYSGVHNNLYKGLSKNGIDVTLISSSDGYKKIPTQISWKIEKSTKISRLLGVHGGNFWKSNQEILDRLVGYDVVQIINPYLIEDASVGDNIQIFLNLKKNNGKIFLYSCGDDYNWVSSCLFGSVRKYWFNEIGFYKSKEMIHPLRYILNPNIRELCKEVYKLVDGIIPGSLDYDWCVNSYENSKEMIPFPIDLSNLEYKQVRKNNYYKVIHGRQPGKEIRKGDKYFEKSVRSFTNHLIYNAVGGVPFSKYIDLIKEGDIFFDQIHSSDQGVNALLAMGCGSVVFSGFSHDFLRHYKLEENSVGINATTDVNNMSENLRKILADEIDVEEISFNARKFVIENHEQEIIARKFLKVWCDLE